MKALSFTRLYLVGALILGLSIAWSATASQPMTGSQLMGACENNCSGTKDSTCAAESGGACDDETAVPECYSDEIDSGVCDKSGTVPCHKDCGISPNDEKCS